MKRTANPITVIGSRFTKRQVLPTTFRKRGIPTRQALAVQRGARWRAAVISVWSFMGDELGRERCETARTYASSIEAMDAAKRMQAKMDRAEPLDQDTQRAIAIIRAQRKTWPQWTAR